MGEAQAMPRDSAPFDTVRWLTEYHARHGRAPRVLHIGNIANNAYINAKALNAAGFDCDVIAYDYYHIMGCPEWEDSGFAGEIEDPMFPDWSSVDLRGYERPRWFAQGPMRACVDYLIAKRSGSRLAGLAWRRLAFARASICNQRVKLLRRRVRELALALRAGVLRLATPWLRSVAWARRLAAAIGAGVRARLARWSRYAWPFGTTAVAVAGLLLFLISIPIVVISVPLLLVLCVLYSPIQICRMSIAWRRARDARRATPTVEQVRFLEPFGECFAAAFPTRADRLVPEDLFGYYAVLRDWHALLGHYDAVVGYSTDGVLPLLCGKRPYIAYEHGTIRNIPFEATSQGRLCALTYRLADVAMITNCDNIVAARRLGLTNHRFVPHPVNESAHGSGTSAALRERLCAELRARFLVFHPARQHWEERRHPDWEKGNDILIRGFARFVHEVAPDAAAVFVDWGQTVEQSKRLIAELGVADRVRWIPTQSNSGMIDYIQACDLLADQFHLGAFGSTMPKALLHGCPAMLYLDEERHRWCLPEMPPLLNARTPEEVFDGLAALYGEPGLRDDLVRRGREWYERYHSNRVIVDAFAESLASALAEVERTR